jgi:hypothetical protein
MQSSRVLHGFKNAGITAMLLLSVAGNFRSLLVEIGPGDLFRSGPGFQISITIPYEEAYQTWPN